MQNPLRHRLPGQRRQQAHFDPPQHPGFCRALQRREGRRRLAPKPGQQGAQRSLLLIRYTPLGWPRAHRLSRHTALSGRLLRKWRMAVKSRERSHSVAATSTRARAHQVAGNTGRQCPAALGVPLAADVARRWWRTAVKRSSPQLKLLRPTGEHGAETLPSAAARSW